MNRINYNMKEHGFVGHLSIPEQSTKYGVIVIMGGEQSLLPGTLIADRFADYGIAALAVSLFGAEGLSDGANQISLDMFIPALKVLKDMGCTNISTYGMSMGSIFAALIPKYIGGVDNVILCSPKSPFLLGVNQQDDVIHEAVQKSWINRQMRLEL